MLHTTQIHSRDMIEHYVRVACSYDADCMTGNSPGPFCDRGVGENEGKKGECYKQRNAILCQINWFTGCNVRCAACLLNSDCIDKSRPGEVCDTAQGQTHGKCYSQPVTKLINIQKKGCLLQRCRLCNYWNY